MFCHCNGIGATTLQYNRQTIGGNETPNCVEIGKCHEEGNVATRLAEAEIVPSMAEQAEEDAAMAAKFYQRGRIKCSPEEEAKLERQHFWRIINAFKVYRIHVQERVQRAQRHFLCLPQKHQDLLPGVLPNLARITQCAQHNQRVLQAIVQNSLHIFQNIEYSEKIGLDVQENSKKVHPSSTFDMEKLKATIKQFVRDWSESGQAERDSCYGPIIQEIQRLFPKDQCDVSKVNVLVPGAGLGRLAWEIARLGYACQGNEWSFFMLFSSNFVLNCCQDVNAMTLYPWIHQFSNHKKSSNQTRPITFPDVNPQGLPETSDFSMVAGDFMEVYNSKPEYWDCVATCFFIDTANNVIEYMETIWKILKPGGVWINLGPLLYHFENMANELSVELSYEDIRSAMINFGFTIEMEKESMQTTYTEDDRSMMRYVYDCVFFVARKPADLYSKVEDDAQQEILPSAAKSPRREDVDCLS